MKAVTNNIRISPKKLSIMARLVRGMPVEEALTRLKFTPLKAARIVYKTLASATANAENTTKAKRKTLTVATIMVQKGPVLKRGVPVSRGRWHRIQKRMSHLTIILASSAPEAKQTVKPKKSESTTEAVKKVSSRVKKAVSKRSITPKK